MGYTCEAAEKAYVVQRCHGGLWVAAFRRLRIQLAREGQAQQGNVDWLEHGQKAPRPRFRSAKRTAFHSLLHQCRYATTLLMSRFTLFACTQRCAMLSDVA